MRRTLLLWSLASVLVVLAACGRTDTPTSKVFEAVTPAADSQPAAQPPAPTPTTIQAEPPTTAPAPPPTQPAPEPTPALTAGQRVQVTGAGADGVNMRGEPSTTAPRVKGLLDGSQLEIVGADRQADGRLWRNVKDPADGASGWVAADFLAAATDPPAPAPPPVAEKPTAPTPTAGQAAPTPAPAAKPAAPAAPAPTAVPKVVAPAAAAKPAGNCHTSYPDFCIPPAPPDLNCTSPLIGGRKNFTVRQPDPHNFDTDRDGIGCEARR